MVSRKSQISATGDRIAHSHKLPPIGVGEALRTHACSRDAVLEYSACCQVHACGSTREREFSPGSTAVRQAERPQSGVYENRGTLGRGESGQRKWGEEEENASRARVVYLVGLHVCWETLARRSMIPNDAIVLHANFAIQMGRELAVLKIQLDEAQERFDICQNQWQEIKNDCDDLKKRKAHLRVFGTKSEMRASSHFRPKGVGKRRRGKMHRNGRKRKESELEKFPPRKLRARMHLQGRARRA